MELIKIACGDVSQACGLHPFEFENQTIWAFHIVVRLRMAVPRNIENGQTTFLDNTMRPFPPWPQNLCTNPTPMPRLLVPGVTARPEYAVPESVYAA